MLQHEQYKVCGAGRGEMLQRMPTHHTTEGVDLWIKALKQLGNDIQNERNHQTPRLRMLRTEKCHDGKNSQQGTKLYNMVGSQITSPTVSVQYQ